MSEPTSRDRPVHPAARDDRWWRRPRGAALLAAALLALGAQLLRTAWLCDDAFISLRMVDNLVDGRGFTFNAGDRVLAVTNPLWTMLLAVGYAVTDEAFYTTLALSAAISAAAVAVLLCAIAPSARAAALGAALVVLSRSFVDYGTSGLENPLTHLLLGAFLALHLRAAPGRADLRRLALLAGLGVMNRPDSALLFAPVLLARNLERPGRSALVDTAVGLAPLLAWCAFATLYFGSPIPNTALAKIDGGVPGLALQGLRYLALCAEVDPLLAAAIAVGAPLALLARVPGAPPVAAGVALSVAYTVAIGGDFMVGRFLTAAFYASVALIVRLPLPALPRLAPLFAAIVALAAVAPLRAQLTAGGPWARQTGDPPRPLPRHGVSDERLWYRHELGLRAVLRGRATPPVAPPAASAPGHRAGDPPRRVAVEGTAGVRAFVQGPDVHVLDLHALSDPLLARLPTVAADWRPGHPRRVIPTGYLATLRSGENRLEDPDLGRLYDRLELIRRGPLLAPDRLRAIAELLVTGDGRYVDAERYRNPPRVAVDASGLADATPLAFGMPGVWVRWPGAIRAGALVATLSEQHDFTVTYFRNGRPVASVTSDATARGGVGLDGRRIPVPAAIRSDGFDAVLIAPDTWYSDQQFRIGAVALRPPE